MLIVFDYPLFLHALTNSIDIVFYQPRKRMTDLPKHLEGLMGEANMKFAKGEYDEAISMCSELIRTGVDLCFLIPYLKIKNAILESIKFTQQFLLIGNSQ